MHTILKKLVLPCALLLAACGAGKIILNIDIDSFMTEAQRSLDYDVPVPPTGGTAPGFTVVGPEEVTVPEGVGSSIDVESGVLTLVMEGRNVTGRATIDLSLKLANSIPGLLLGEVLSFSMDLAPDSTSVAEESIDLVQDVLELFEGETLYIQLDVENITIPSGQAVGTRLAGTLVAEGIDVRIVSRDNLF